MGLQETNPSLITRPLHALMMECVLTELELQARIHKIDQDENVKTASNSGRLVYGGRPVATQNLDPVKKELVATAREPKTTAIETLIQTALKDIKKPGALRESRHGGTSQSSLRNTGGFAGDDSRQPPQPTGQTMRQHRPQTPARPASTRT